MRDAVAAERCVVLDGGIATALDHRYGQDEDTLWGVQSLSSTPDEVVAVHRAYADAGAEVITTNTWGLMTAVAADPDLGGSRAGARNGMNWMEIARRGVDAARQGIAQAERDDAACVALSLNGDIDGPDGEEVAALLLRALNPDPPDLLLVETLSVLRPSLFSVIEVLLGGGLPVWLSFRRCTEGLCGVYGQHWGGPEGDGFGRAARRFEEMGVQALLVNCIPPDHVPGMVSYLRDYTDLPLGVYPNLGYYTDAGWRFETEVGGEEYAEMALQWRAEGAQIIGGCCGTGPTHIAAARAALQGTRPGSQRLQQRRGQPEQSPNSPVAAGQWTDGHHRPLVPLEFPVIAAHPEVTAVCEGSFLLWKHLYDRRLGGQQRCLDVGSGAGLQSTQLALNGAAHVHAIDVSSAAVENTLDNAFRNGVADSVTAEIADLFPWLPSERYELIVANLPQVPADPAEQVTSHRPIDFWGRGLFDQVLTKLPEALAPEGSALVTMNSCLSRSRTDHLLAEAGLRARVVDWTLSPAPWAAPNSHISRVERLTDAFHVSPGGGDVVVIYLLEIRHEGNAKPLDSTQ